MATRSVSKKSTRDRKQPTTKRPTATKPSARKATSATTAATTAKAKGKVKANANATAKANAKANAKAKAKATPARRDAAPATSVSPETAIAITKVQAMIAELRGHAGVTVTGRTTAKPVPARDLDGWESKTGLKLPAEYRELLTAHGPFSVAWAFKRKTDWGEIVGGDVAFLAAPQRHPFAKEAALPAFEHLWLISQGESFRHAFRFAPGKPPELVTESINDDGSLWEVSDGFARWLGHQCEWYFARSWLHAAEAHVAPATDGVRPIAALENFLFDRPPVDPTDPRSLVRAIAEAADSADRSRWTLALVALGATDTAPDLVRIAEQLLAKPRKGENDEADALRLLQTVWSMQRGAGVEISRRLLAKPPKGKDISDQPVAPYAIALAHAFLLHGGDAAERTAARTALLAILSRDEEVSMATEPMEEALGADDSPEARVALVERVRNAPDAHTALRVLRILAARGSTAALDALIATVIAADPENHDYLIRSFVWTVGLDCTPNHFAKAKPLVERWLRELAERLPREGVAAIPGDTPRITVSTEPTIGRYLAPERVEILEVREPHSLEPIRAFANARELRLRWSPRDGKTALDVRPLAALRHVEKLEISGVVTPAANLEELAAMSSLVDLTVGGESNGGLRDAGIKKLVQALPALTRLKRLDISHSDYGKDALAALAASPSLSRLESLTVTSAASDAQLEKLRKAAGPRCVVSN